jgi:cytochrome c oxidase cbb3-type subunit 3
MRLRLAGLCLALVATALANGCEREQRDFQARPPESPAVRAVTLSELKAGPATPAPASPVAHDDNAYDVSEGKRLFTWYNCEGCHAKGGGGIGPPLMDATWIYGAEPANIFATIVQGRPNGMPSFRGRIPENQVWQLAAYVRSMSGLLRKDVSPSRDDHIRAKKSEQSQDEQSPQLSNIPPAATQSQ